MSDHFADRLITRVRQLGHPLCVGLDPHLRHLPPLFQRGASAADPRTVAGVGDFLHAVLDRIGDRVAIVKPQIAFFECLGWRGLRLLDEIVARARRQGLLVLLDAKRGDIGSTAAAYAAAYLGEDAPLRADAITLAPYLGLDSMAPFVDASGAGISGLFVLVRTSNPGARDYQDLATTSEDADGRDADERDDALPLYRRVAASLAPAAADLIGPTTGWSSLGAVVGATWPGQAEALRQVLPTSLFLIPGFGAQGAGAQDAVRSFVPGPAGREGGIVSSSRGILFPAGSATDDDGTWERAIDAALDEAIDTLGSAISR
ncbi:MAG: orotidine-5'-phosphate decarboxylase [Acidobacteriota bacterium]